MFCKNNALFYIIVIYYHFNIPTVGPFRCADTHLRKALLFCPSKIYSALYVHPDFRKNFNMSTCT